MKKKGKRETATKQVRLYNSTLEFLQNLKDETGKPICRIIDEKVRA